MLTAIFGDIHANLEALDAGLADVGARGADSYVCLGDRLGYVKEPIRRGRLGKIEKVTHD